MNHDLFQKLNDPLAFARFMWPDVNLWSKQREAVLAVRDCTVVAMPACKEIGKDFAAGFIALSFFINPRMYFPKAYVGQIEGQRTTSGRNPHTRRIITTSIKDEHLDVLWGEIERWYSTCRFPLDHKRGGPFVINHHEIRFKEEADVEIKNPLNYLRGQVSKPDSVEGMSGHHAAYTLFIGDEASGLRDPVHKGAQGWAKRFFYPGNTNPCRNFWYDICKGGDKRDESGKLTTKVIRVSADESPNVLYGLRQQARGIEPTNEVLVPGILTWERRQWKLDNLKPVEVDIDLKAKFPSDESVLLFPEEWLRNSMERAEQLSRTQGRRTAKAMGVDPAEGGDRTAFCIVDEWGVLELVSLKTPDTTKTFDLSLAMIRRWNVPADKVVFDRACGKPHADRLRSLGMRVRTVHFGESIQLDIKRGLTKVEDRRENREEKSLYKNRRVEMYHELSAMMNPKSDRAGFAIPANLKVVPRPEFNLFDQLEPVPYMFDKESGDGKLILPPKEAMIRELYGGRGSPDEADALVLAVNGLTHKGVRSHAGAA